METIQGSAGWGLRLLEVQGEPATNNLRTTCALGLCVERLPNWLEDARIFSDSQPYLGSTRLKCGERKNDSRRERKGAEGGGGWSAKALIPFL
jgi:hypothetical protein